MDAGGVRHNKEMLARLFLLVQLVAAAAVLLSAYLIRQDYVLLRAAMPEQGGWMPSDLKATAGEPLELHLISEDVTHGFAVGRHDAPAVDVNPGEYTQVTLLFDRPGKYVYYCTRWCGINHWRMRGTIEVSAAEQPGGEKQPGGEGQPEQTAETPLYLQLGIDIDAPHPAAVAPAARPAAESALHLLSSLPETIRSREYYISHSPAQVWQELRQEASVQTLDDRQVWSLVAALWQAQTSPERLAYAREQYSQNCTACHGVQGAGDGVAARQIASGALDGAGVSMDGHGLQKPGSFADSSTMLGASPALLAGKIVRGGMGTGMPYWGPIFDDDQVGAIIEYLYTFQFDYNLEVKDE
jgi:cytochrome c oxidase subunit 2